MAVLWVNMHSDNRKETMRPRWYKKPCLRIQRDVRQQKISLIGYHVTLIHLNWISTTPETNTLSRHHTLPNNGHLQPSRQDSDAHRLHHLGRRSNWSLRPTPLHERPAADSSEHDRIGHGKPFSRHSSPQEPMKPEADNNTGRQIPHVHRVPDLHRTRPSSSPLAKLQSVLDPKCARSSVLDRSDFPHHASQSGPMRGSGLQAQLGRDGLVDCTQVCPLSRFSSPQTGSSTCSFS
jgi:hypothetical protein